MKAYRYLDDTYGPRFWSLGLIGISTTHSVAEIEGRQRDKRDSAIEVHWDGNAHLGAAANSPAVHEAAKRVRIGMPQGGGLIIGSASRIEQVGGLMMCLSTNPESKAFQGKDWVFEITDIRAFVDSLFWAANGRLPLAYHSGEVIYRECRFDANEDCNPEPNPFYKQSGMGYEDEEEYRIFWPINGPRPRFNILSPHPLKWVRLVRRP